MRRREVVPGIQTTGAQASAEGKQVRLLEAKELVELNMTGMAQCHVSIAQILPPVRRRVRV